jgi:hypothetical protein
VGPRGALGESRTAAVVFLAVSCRGDLSAGRYLGTRDPNPSASGSGTLRTTRSRLVRAAWIGLAAATYIAYLALLITCDVLRVPPRGFVPRFEDGRVTVSSVVPGSVAAQVGLEEGDRILGANGQTLAGLADWQRVGVHLDPSRPLILEIERRGRLLTAVLRLTAGLEGWRQGMQSPGVLAFRSAQVVTLGFAILVAFRRSFKPAALLGAVMLASMATVSLALPMRMAVFWDALPTWLELLLWVPFTTSAAAGPLLFAFSAVFPQRVWSWSSIVAALLPGVGVVVWHLYAGVHLMRELGPAPALPNAVTLVFLVNVVYAVLAIVLLVSHRREASTLTDERRIRVLILGTAIGAAAAVGVIVGYWRNPGAGVFATRGMTLLSLVFLAMPASFAYAILRHRLFDVRLIVRQGLRYALARRFVDALMPILGGLLLVDVLVHREQSLVAVVQARWWWYFLLAAALLVVRSRREQWLIALDRRFFRERYDAQRLLTNIAEHVARASSFDAIAPTIVQQMDEALHPTFIGVMRHVPARSTFCGGSGPVLGSSPSELPESMTVIGLLALLRKPLALSLGDTAWVRHQLPPEERTLLLQQGIELLVPISTESAGELPLGLLVLGPRRSEEPYNQEDMDLLSTIAHAVGVLLQRSTEDQRGIAECDHCGACFQGATQVCVHDGRALTQTRGTLVLNERYRLDRRLGRGGMGTVYLAVDSVLDRRVAVKVIREGFAAPLDLAARFRREARVAAGFAHPHVVRVYDFGVDRGGRPFLVMELLEGRTLRERLASGTRFDASEMLHTLRGVCSALEAAHACSLVHRDLKPENIFLQCHASGTVPKVLDFGLAKALDPGPGASGSTTMATTAGMLVGTVEYMAPEQLAGDEVSPGWDVWALGVIAYEMVTGVHPFRRGSLLEHDGRSDSLGTTRESRHPPLSDELDEFFRRALSPNRDLRPRQAMDFLGAFEQVLA